jgi:hypothetical protein
VLRHHRRRWTDPAYAATYRTFVERERRFAGLRLLFCFQGGLLEHCFGVVSAA